MPQMSAWCRSPFCMEGTRGPIQFPHGSQSYSHSLSLLSAGERSGWTAHSGYSTSTEEEHSSTPGWALARDGYAGTGKIKAQQTLLYVPIKTSNNNNLPLRAALSTPTKNIWGLLQFFFLCHTCELWGWWAPWQWQQLLLVAAGTTGARRTSELSGSLASGALAHLFQALPQRHGKGRIRRQDVGCLLASNPVAFTRCGLPPKKLWLLIWEGSFFSASCIHIYI